MNYRTPIAGLALAGFLAVAAWAQTAPTSMPADPNKVVLGVAGQTVTARDFAEFVSDLPPEIQQAAWGPDKRYWAEQMIRVKLMVGEARRRGLQDVPKVQRELAMAREEVLVKALAMEVQAAVDTSDAGLKRAYEEHKTDFEEVEARHIVAAVTDAQPEDKARARIDAIRARLLKGEDFAAIAKAESDDKASGSLGGAVQPFGRKTVMHEAFKEAALALKNNEISPPVRTPDGWHIIQVTGRSTAEFDRIKGQVRDWVLNQAMENLLDKLRAAEKPQIDETFFGPPATRRQ
jgi:parvulin-like peptidyl-prolyl isomerase